MTSRRYPVEITLDADDVDDLAFLGKTLTQAESLLDNLG